MTYFMKTNKRQEYLNPEIEISEVVVELGFAVTGGDKEQLPEYEEEDDIIIIG